MMGLQSFDKVDQIINQQLTDDLSTDSDNLFTLPNDYSIVVKDYNTDGTDCHRCVTGHRCGTYYAAHIRAYMYIIICGPQLRKKYFI